MHSLINNGKYIKSTYIAGNPTCEVKFRMITFPNHILTLRFNCHSWFAKITNQNFHDILILVVWFPDIYGPLVGASLLVAGKGHSNASGLLRISRACLPVNNGVPYNVSFPVTKSNLVKCCSRLLKSFTDDETILLTVNLKFTTHTVIRIF